MAFEQFKYQNNYNKEHYARLSVLIPPEDKEIIEKHWKKKGFKSFSAYANDLIRKDINENEKAGVHIETINNANGNINIG